MKPDLLQRRILPALGALLLSASVAMVAGWRGFHEGSRAATSDASALSALQQTRALQALHSGESASAMEILEEGLDVALVNWWTTQQHGRKLFIPPDAWGHDLDLTPLLVAAAQYRREHPRHGLDSPVRYIDDELATLLPQPENP